MTAPGRLLDYFILEASDNVERLDAVLAKAAGAGPDAEALARSARALRGSATMSRLASIAELAASLERIGRALRDGTLRWDAALRGALVSAVDDLKLLIRNVRSWSAADDERARTRVGELAAYGPQLRSQMTPSAGGGSGAAFLAGEAANVAAALAMLVARPNDRLALDDVLRRVRALRGVAAIRDLPPLPDIMEAVEKATKPLELGVAGLRPAQSAVLSAALTALHRAVAEMRSAGRPDSAAPEVRQFAAAYAKLEESAPGAERIVPVAELFFADAGPHVLSRAPNPPTTPAERFRLEIVSHAEHLRRLVGEARAASDQGSRERLGRQLRGEMRELKIAADGFAEREVAAFAERSAHGVGALDPAALSALDDVAALLANPATDREALVRRLAGGAAAPKPQPAAAAAPPPAARPAAPTPSGTPRSTRLRSATPTGRELQALLQDGITKINRLEERPLSEPVPILEDGLIPIERLLYKGEAALARAREIRDSVKARGKGQIPEPLAELFDLLDLASAE
ncbi:MAG TPA: Hpt domain-containing protein [Gemmatimonadaceae bacterium]|nr:Hpt domain-containing protein [Gemmatimonadaceae bacterium]